MLRKATEADLDALVAMGERFRARSSYQTKIAHNAAQTRALGVQLITGGDGAILVAERDGTLIGMLGIVAFAHPMSGDRTAGEMFWWVDESERGSAGVLLFAGAKDWALAHGAKFLQMAAPTLGVKRFYQRQGFEEVETLFQLAL